MTIAKKKVVELRRELEEERDRIDAQIDLLDQYLELEEDVDDEPAPPAPPASRKKIVRKRKKRKKAAEIFKKKPPAKKPAVRKKPPPRIAAEPEPDQKPIKCGGGKSEVVKDSNMDKVVSVIRGRAPHWVTHQGIVEAAKAMGLNIPKTFLAIIHQECLRLRAGRYKVPGLEYKMVGRRAEYRMPETTTDG